MSTLLKNLDAVKQQLAGIELVFSVTVTQLSCRGLSDLLDYGRSLGVSQYHFREVALFIPESGEIRDQRFPIAMQDLILAPGQFDAIRQDLQWHSEFKKVNYIPAKRQNEKRSSVLK